MIRRLCGLTSAALLALWGTSSAAQELFRQGEIVSGTTGNADTACLSQGQLERYISAKESCPQGDSDSCSAAKGLENQGVCGVHFGAYVVMSVDNKLGWMQISPASDQTVTYWADTRDFKVAD
jgi:hypothetical protein